MQRHKVFISFHHGEPLIDPNCGQRYKERFEKLFDSTHDAIISRSVQDGDIKDGLATETTRQIIRDEYISDASVTVVLVGPETWKRKHIDWEISSSIRETSRNPRCGLIGILLPTYMDKLWSPEGFDPYTIPPRLYMNIKNGYARMYKWTENPNMINEWVHEAFLRRSMIPDNSYPSFANNRSSDQRNWSY